MSEPDFVLSRKAFIETLGAGPLAVELPVAAWAPVGDLAPALERVGSCRGAVLQVREWERWICVGAVNQFRIDKAPAEASESGPGLELYVSVYRVMNEADALDWCHDDRGFGFTTEDFHIGFTGAVTQEPRVFPPVEGLIEQEFSIRLITTPEIVLLRQEA